MAAAALALAAAAAGCRYGTTGSLPADLRTIGVTMLRNNTRYPGLEVEATSAVTSALQSQGRLTVIDAESDPDLLLTGTIDRYEVRSVRTDRFGDPVRFGVILQATVTVRKAGGGYVLRKSRIDSRSQDMESGAVDLTRGESEALGRAAAAAELGRNIARRIVESGW